MRLGMIMGDGGDDDETVMSLDVTPYVMPLSDHITGRQSTSIRKRLSFALHKSSSNVCIVFLLSVKQPTNQLTNHILYIMRL